MLNPVANPIATRSRDGIRETFPRWRLAVMLGNKGVILRTLKISGGSKLVDSKDYLCSRPLNLDVRMLFINNLYVRRLSILVGIVLSKWIRLLED